MAENKYEQPQTSSTYGEDDFAGGGEQFASALYLNEQLKAQTLIVNGIKVEAEAAQASADSAKVAAENAETAAENAQNSADAANNLLADLSNDNKLTSVEKQATQKEWEVIDSEKPINEIHADNYSIVSDKETYVDAYNDLKSYITPILADLNTTTDIVGSTFRSKFKAYYDAKTNLLRTISIKAKELADEAAAAAEAAKQLAETKQNAIVLQPTEPPLNPEVGDMWIDTSIYPNIIYTWENNQWNRATVISAEEVGTYDTAHIDETFNNVQIDMESIRDRTTIIESDLNDGESLASKITESTTYAVETERRIDDKVEQFGENLKDEDYVNQHFPQMVTSSVLEQRAAEISAQFAAGGGVNLLKNSVWYGGSLNWQVTSGAASQYIGADAIEAGSGFSMVDGVIKQVIKVTAGQPYTITSKIRKGTAGSAYMKLSDGNQFRQMDMIENAAYNYTPIQIANFIPQTNSLIVEFGATGATGGAIFTASMVNAGEVGLQWSHANGEMYNTAVTFDINGIQVNSSEYDGYTVMSPQEFSGYYRNNQGVMQRVFTLNKDVTEVVKLKVTDEIEMGSIKAVYINGGGYRGWSFIPST